MNPVRNDNYVSREMISNGVNVVSLQVRLSTLTALETWFLTLIKAFLAILLKIKNLRFT